MAKRSASKRHLPFLHSSFGWLTIAGLIGAGVAALAYGWVDRSHALLLAILVATGLFVLMGWTRLWSLDARESCSDALGEHLNIGLEELVVVLAEGAALSAVVAMLLMGKTAENQAAAVVAVVAVFLAWAGLHLMYAIRYAGLYYTAPVGGIDFNSEEAPSYRDFLYFSYNLGMTYQVSDTAVASREIRSVVLRHCLLSYAFGTVVLATTVNLLVGFVST